MTRYSVMRMLAVVSLVALGLALGAGHRAAAGCCGPVWARDAQWFPDGKRIAFVMGEGGGGDFEIRDPAATTDKTIVRDAQFAALSPDGSEVAAIVPAKSSGWTLSLVHLPDGATRAIGPASFSQPAWSPDGSLVAFTANGVELVDVASGVLHETGLASGSTASWSPDSRFVAISSDTGLWRVDMNGGKLLLAPPPASRPLWSPDGSVISFERAGDLWLVRPDGTGMHELRSRTTAAAWSPDGTRMAAVLTDRGDIVPGDPTVVGNVGELGLVALDGSTQPLGVVAEEAEAWSPDGRSIAFAIDNGNGNGVELIHPDGSGHRELVFGCAPAGSRQLIGCSYFGGYTVPPMYARRPLQVRLHVLPSSTATTIDLQVGIRDARTYRVRAAGIRVSVSPARAATVQSAETKTLNPGTASVDLVQHGRLPKNFKVHVTVVAPAGGTLARFVVRCSELGFAARRGC